MNFQPVIAELAARRSRLERAIAALENLNPKLNPKPGGQLRKWRNNGDEDHD